MTGKNKEHNTLIDLMSDTHQQQKEELQSRLESRHDEAIEKVKSELGAEHDA